MRIVIDYTPAVHQQAGIGRHTRGLVQGLAAAASRHELHLLVFGRPADGQSIVAPPGCRLQSVPIANRWLAIAWQRLRLPLPVEWLSGPADIYHASDFVLPPLRQARGLLTVHDLSFLTVPRCAEASLRSYLSQAVPPSVRRADHILADSENSKRDLVELLGTPAEKISVIYPGVESHFRPPDDPAALRRVRQRYQLGDQPFVLSVGRLEPRKNFPALIRAWAKLRRETRLPHRLVIAGGKGWLYENIFETARASSLGDEIIFTGFVNDADLPALYAAADVFAFLSLYEGFGIPVVEAMACGTPVVCANNSSLPEAAGDAALLVDLADETSLTAALQRLIEDSVLRTELRRRGFQQASHFTWQESAAHLLAIYEEIGRHA